MSAKKTAFYGMFLALALVAGYIEQLIPINLGIPEMCIRDRYIATLIRKEYFLSKANLIIEEVNKVIIGKEKVIRKVWMMILSGGHAVSYTHLDVYKRQIRTSLPFCKCKRTIRLFLSSFKTVSICIDRCDNFICL